MTIQSFNRLNTIALKNNLQNCVSSRQFTDNLKMSCQKQIEARSLDEVGFAVLINELGKIEREMP